MPNSTYPFAFLSGSGVAFKLLCGIAQTLHPNNTEQYTKIIGRYTDLAMLGTIADCMPLTNENRTIASLGLQTLKKTQVHGLKKLLSTTHPDTFDGDTIGFFVGPRINAAGRMDTPYTALKMLLAGDEKVDEIITEIEDLNVRRKAETYTFLHQAMESVNPKDGLLFFVSKETSHGIIGLIAGRLTETFERPSIVLKDDGEVLVASCRSPEHFSIIALLEQFKTSFVRFGGHAQAAGFTITKANFAQFQKDSTTLAKNILSTLPEPSKTLTVETIIQPQDINANLLNEIDTLKPFGIGNAKPLFLLKSPIVSRVEFL